ncbi:MAG: sigma-70 family RNA polymerase sigma factor [Myxococcota bacterium]
MLRTTRWTLVLRAGAGSLSALEDLCGAYWFPVYAWFRKRGLAPEDAAEQTQEFFAGLLRRGDLGKVQRDGRRFRAWLYTALTSHHGNVRKHDQAQRRRRIEVDDAEARFASQVAPGLDPEQVFARQWALATLATARDRVRETYTRRGQSDEFAALEPTLTGGAPPYRELAARLDRSEGAVKVAVHRLKKRFGDALRDEVSETIDGPDEVDAELRQLLDALAGR